MKRTQVSIVWDSSLKSLEPKINSFLDYLCENPEEEFEVVDIKITEDENRVAAVIIYTSEG